MTSTRREIARENLKENPPTFKIGDRINVDGIGEDLLVAGIKLGAQDWSIEVRMDDHQTWIVPAKNCWQ